MIYLFERFILLIYCQKTKREIKVPY